LFHKRVRALRIAVSAVCWLNDSHLKSKLGTFMKPFQIIKTGDEYENKIYSFNGVSFKYGDIRFGTGQDEYDQTECGRAGSDKYGKDGLARFGEQKV